MGTDDDDDEDDDEDEDEDEDEEDIAVTNDGSFVVVGVGGVGIIS
jgi:hypothetical protein